MLRQRRTQQKGVKRFITYVMKTPESIGGLSSRSEMASENKGDWLKFLLSLLDRAGEESCLV